MKKKSGREEEVKSWRLGGRDSWLTLIFAGGAAILFSRCHCHYSRLSRQSKKKYKKRAKSRKPRMLVKLARFILLLFFNFSSQW